MSAPPPDSPYWKLDSALRETLEEARAEGTA